MAINKITLDYDIIDLKDSIRKLIKNYIYARLKYGPDKVRVFLSSSKRGFRLEISDVGVSVFDNILERVRMDDDPYRIYFALKRYAASGNEEDVDIAFYSKKYVKDGKVGVIEEINLEEILGDYLEKLENTYGTKHFEELLNDIVSKLEEKFKQIVKPNQVVYLVVDKEILDNLIKDISNSRIKYRVLYNVYEEEKPILRLIGDLDKIKELVSKYKDKVYKMKVVTEYSKH